jgi:hypothetical protein
MTSFERQGDSTYNGIPEPRYSVLSYTWGRFTAKTESDGSRLEIGGVTWAIPAIDKHRAFNAAEFENVIKQTSVISGNRFVWVDVACIDQENITVKMEEIGRQAGIFANARAAFVWLWTAALDELRESIDNMAGVLSIWPKAANLAQWLSLEGPDSITTRSKQDQDGCSEHDAAALERLRRAVYTILGDWWFSSLWTLQEQGLKEDAWVLSREGLPVENEEIDSEYYESTNPSNGNVTDWKIEMLYASIFDVTVGLRDTFHVLQLPYLQHIFQDPDLQHTTNHISDLIRHAGYTSIPVESNPNFFFTLARTRKATYELDRIYGTMSLYNIRVGAAGPDADVSKRYTLEELEEEFNFALNAKSPILGQLFLHVEEPHHGKTWQMTQWARVPDILSDLGFDFHSGADGPSIFDGFEVVRGIPGGPAKIRGSITPFECIIQHWRAVFAPENKRGSFESQVILQVDDYICKANTSIPYVNHLQSDRQMQRAKYINATIEGLIETFGSKRRSIIGLGETGTGGSDPSPRSYALLLLHDELDSAQCRRIGICYCVDLCLRDSVYDIGDYSEWAAYEGFIF